MSSGIILRAVSYLILLAAVASGETLADAARRERARRASGGEPAPVYGNAELERATPGEGTFSAPGGTAARGGADDAGHDPSQDAARRRIGADYARLAPRAQRVLEDAAVHAGTCGGRARPARCRGDAMKLAARATALAGVLSAADDLGREARLLPGELRELARRHGMEDMESALRRIWRREAARPSGMIAMRRRLARGGAARPAARRPAADEGLFAAAAAAALVLGPAHQRVHGDFLQRRVRGLAQYGLSAHAERRDETAPVVETAGEPSPGSSRTPAILHPWPIRSIRNSTVPIAVPHSARSRSSHSAASGGAFPIQSTRTAIAHLRRFRRFPSNVRAVRCARLFPCIQPCVAAFSAPPRLADDYMRRVTVPERGAEALFGNRDENLRFMEETLGVRIRNDGPELLIEGDEKGVHIAEQVFTQLAGMMVEGYHPSSGDVRLAAAAPDPGPDDAPARLPVEVGDPQRPEGRDPAQPQPARLPRADRKHDIVFGIGPAGTGKTYLAVAEAVAALNEKAVSRIVLARPAVEAGEKLGFLPGDLQEKVDPYLRPLYDALYDILDVEQVAKLLERNAIEVAPIAFMRGRTLNDAFVIIDEAQNTTTEQMKMVLTRIGFGSQGRHHGGHHADRPAAGPHVGARRGHADPERMEGIAFVYFDEKDVVRHSLVQSIIKAYEAHNGATKTGPRPLRPCARGRLEVVLVNRQRRRSVGRGGCGGCWRGRPASWTSRAPWPSCWPAIACVHVSTRATVARTSPPTCFRSRVQAENTDWETS